MLADERFLELIGGPRAPAFCVVPLLQPPLEDGTGIAQSIREVVELGDMRLPGRDRLTSRQRRAAFTAATWARTMRQRTRTAISSPRQR